MRRCVSILALVLLAGAGLAVARHGLGTLAGTVVDTKGRAVAGARVTVEMADGEHPHATATDSKGRFYFASYSAGLYNLRAYHKGEWSDWLNNITIKTGKVTDVTLRLRPAPAK